MDRLGRRYASFLGLVEPSQMQGIREFENSTSTKVTTNYRAPTRNLDLRMRGPTRTLSFL